MKKSKASIHTNDKVYFKNYEVTLPNNETDSSTKEAASVHPKNFNLNSNGDKFVTTKQNIVPHFIVYSNGVISSINRTIKATPKVSSAVQNLQENLSKSKETTATEEPIRLRKNARKMFHQCEVCLKSYRTKFNLKIHKRTHTGEKPYSCPTCGKSFTTKSNLKDHEITHSKERNFKCEVCPDGRCFKSKRELKIHMLYHSEPKYPCPHCDRKFHTSSQLSSHSKTHFRPLSACKKCGKKMRQNLKRHEKICSL